MATLTIAIEINDVRQPGAVTIDLTTPPAEATYTLTCAGGTFAIDSTYNTDMPSSLKKLDFAVTATLADQSHYRYVGYIWTNNAGSSYDCYEPPPHSFGGVALWIKSGDQWRISTYVTEFVFRFFTPRVVFWANGGVGAPAAIEARFGEAFALPLHTPTREGYAFAGWLPSTPSHDAEAMNWYSNQQPYTLDGVQYVDAEPLCNICCLLGSSNRTEFRRLRPGERVIIDKSAIRRFVNQAPITDNPELTTIESADRLRLYRDLIDTHGPINMVAIWHRCTHMLIRDEAGNLLRGPDGRLLRDD